MVINSVNPRYQVWTSGLVSTPEKVYIFDILQKRVVKTINTKHAQSRKSRILAEAATEQLKAECIELNKNLNG